MNESVLDENLRQIFRRCTPRVTGDDLDRALARFEGRRRPAPVHARVVAAAAAALALAGVLGWVALSPAPRPALAPARQSSPEEIAKQITDLGAASPEVREKAKARLIAMGPAALELLERAIYHEDPEVRVASQAVAKIVRRAEEIRPTLNFNRASVKLARARWTARSFTSLEDAVTAAFEPAFVMNVHYVPRRSIGSFFDMRPGQDSLSKEIVAALSQGDGIVYLDQDGKLVDLGPRCCFTLPDKVGWSAYVVVDLEKREPGDITLLNMVVGEGEGDWAFQAEGLRPQSGGGLKIVDLAPKSSFSRVLKNGDLLRSIGGKVPAGPRDLEPLSVANAKPVVLAVERDEKQFLVGVRVIIRHYVKKPALELEAKAVFEQAENSRAEDPVKALALYTELLSKYAATEFVSVERMTWIRERIADLKEKKKGGK
jgi:hypothetical protein